MLGLYSKSRQNSIQVIFSSKTKPYANPCPPEIALRAALRIVGKARSKIRWDQSSTDRLSRILTC
jgi:hypothetical protein